MTYFSDLNDYYRFSLGKQEEPKNLEISTADKPSKKQPTKTQSPKNLEANNTKKTTKGKK